MIKTYQNEKKNLQITQNIVEMPYFSWLQLFNVLTRITSKAVGKTWPTTKYLTQCINNAFKVEGNRKQKK